MEEREDGGSQEHPLPVLLYYTGERKAEILSFV